MSSFSAKNRSPLGFAYSLARSATVAMRQVAWSRRTIFIAILLLVPAVIGVVLRAYAVPGSAASFRMTVLPILQVGIIELMCLFYGAGIIRDGMEDRTLTFLLVRPLGRTRVTLGMLLGTVALLVPMALVSAIASFSVTTVGIGEGVLGLGDFGAEFQRFLFVSASAALWYTVFFFLMGLIVKNPTIWGLSFFLIVDCLLGSLPQGPSLLAPSSYLEKMLGEGFVVRSLQGARDIPLDLELRFVDTPDGALAVLATSLVLCVGIIFVLSRGKDFVDFQKGEG